MERPGGSAQALAVDDGSPAPTSSAAGEAAASRPVATAVTVAREGPVVSWRQSLPSRASILRGTLIAWVIVSVGIAIGQAIRIVRFRRRLRGAVPAPGFLTDEADRIGQWLGVGVPEMLLVENLGTPMLWCLGKPQLLLPTALVKTLPLERWRGILIHELAHLRRRDHWVSRLELVTGLIWWWNPFYWLTRTRLDAEAELACDAWVVWALPKDRLVYAEALFDICSSMSQAKLLAPVLGMVGSGRFLERRLTMILHSCVPCRLSTLGLVAACLLLIAALPSWSAAKLVDLNHEDESNLTAAALAAVDPLPDLADDDDQDGKVSKFSLDDDDEDDDADDDDEDDEAALARARARAEAARARVKAIERKIEAARGRKQQKAGEKDKSKKSTKSDSVRDLDVDTSRLEKELESKFGEGSEFAKQMEQRGERIGKEMESKFGPGSDFVKQMEKLGKEVGAKFGEGSGFADKMAAVGKELEAKLGPGSEFEKQMKKLGEDMKGRVDSDIAKRAQAKAVPSAKAAAKDDGRQRQIRQLEARVAELMEQLKALRSETEKEDKD